MSTTLARLDFNEDVHNIPFIGTMRPSVSKTEIQTAVKNFLPGSEIEKLSQREDFVTYGEGAMGTVFTAADKYAVKFVIILNKETHAKFDNEVAVLNDLKSNKFPACPKIYKSGVIPYVRYASHDGGHRFTAYLGFMITEKFETTAFQFYSKNLTQNNDNAARFAHMKILFKAVFDLARRGYEALHNSGYMHMDANSNNAMLNFVQRVVNNAPTTVPLLYLIDFERAKKIVSDGGEQRLVYPIENGPKQAKYEPLYDISYFLFHLNMVIAKYAARANIFRMAHPDPQYYVDVLTRAFDNPYLVYWIGIPLTGPPARPANTKMVAPPTDDAVNELCTEAFALPE